MFFNSKILKKEMGFPGGSDGKKKKQNKQTNKKNTCNVGDLGWEKLLKTVNLEHED